MPTSRPSLAIAGVAGFALLAGLVFHLTSTAPRLSPDLALAPASVKPAGGPADRCRPRPPERRRAGGST